MADGDILDFEEYLQRHGTLEAEMLANPEEMLWSAEYLRAQNRAAFEALKASGDPVALSIAKSLDRYFDPPTLGA